MASLLSLQTRKQPALGMLRILMSQDESREQQVESVAVPPDYTHPREEACFKMPSSFSYPFTCSPVCLLFGGVEG